MLAYNQFSGNAALQSSGMGGYGRKGAQRLVILETDGLANASTSASTTNAGAYQGYFNIGPGNSYSSSATDPNTDAINVANQICALYNDSSYGLPGFSTTAKPVSIQCIAFGAILRAHHAGGLQRGGRSRCCSRSRRSAARRFPVRRAIRPTAISGASARSPNDRPCCSKPSRKSWTARCRSRWSNSISPGYQAGERRHALVSRLRLLERHQVFDHVDQVLRAHQLLQIGRHQRGGKFFELFHIGQFSECGRWRSASLITSSSSVLLTNRPEIVLPSSVTARNVS